MADSRSHAEVRFEGAAADRLGGTELGAKVIDRATAALCAEMLGMAEQAFAATNDYLKTRVQFGQLLSSFQALQHRISFGIRQVGYALLHSNEESLNIRHA